MLHDILGLYTDFVPKHTKQYLRLNELIAQALRLYADEVRAGIFPTDKESFNMDEDLLADFDGLG